jgi:hypothetical protein
MPEVEPYLRLRIIMGFLGDPTEIFVECWNGQSRVQEIDDIVSYINTESCFNQKAPYA